MITKEEYKKTLIRMWDSVRKMDKGTDSCSCVGCEECPVNPVCDNHTVSPVNLMNAYEIIESVEKWAKEHPIETNGSRFLKNYPKADVYGCDGEFIFIRLDRAENHTKIPRVWWESEVDDANCN